MAGMVGLGRVFDIAMNVSGQIFKFRHASAVTFVCTNDDTLTVTVGSTHAAATTSPGNIFTYYWTEAGNGLRTSAWVKATLSASNVVTTGSDIMMAVTVFTSQIADPYNYIKGVFTNNDGQTALLFHDLTVQRSPVNLEIPNA